MVKAMEGKFLVVVAPVLKGAAFLNLLSYSLRQDREEVPVANIKTTAIQGHSEIQILIVNVKKCACHDNNVLHTIYGNTTSVWGLNLTLRGRNNMLAFPRSCDGDYDEAVILSPAQK